MVPSLVQEKADTPPVNHRGNVHFFAFSRDLQTAMSKLDGPGALTSSLADGIHCPLSGLVTAPPPGTVWSASYNGIPMYWDKHSRP